MTKIIDTEQHPRSHFVGGLVLGAVASFAVGLGAQWMNCHSQEPRLIGLNCAGAHDALYAYEEDDFPPCDVIVKR